MIMRVVDESTEPAELNYELLWTFKVSLRIDRGAPV